MNGYWYAEIWRIAVTVTAFTLVGGIFGHPFVGSTVGFSLCLAWHLRGIATLNRWLARPTADPSATQTAAGRSGIWASVFHRLHGLRSDCEERIQHLELSLDRHQQATRALPEATVTLGPSGEIEFANRAANTLLGLKDPEDVGLPIANLIRAPGFLEYLDAADHSEALEIKSPVNEGTTLLIRIVSYGDSDKKLLLARDVSRLHRLEQVRRDFVANVSHEMKSPLTVIKGYVEALIDAKDARTSKWDKPLSQIDQQTDRMVRIVEDLLQLSNLETGPEMERPSVVDVPALIRSVKTEAMELSGGNHEISAHIDEQLLLLGSFNELYSAFSNIAINAVRYTPSPGTIQLSWSRHETGGACFSVKDTGIGIAADHVPRLTERFYRVDQARSRQLGGTGLGLAIVKHVLIRHGAQLCVDSELGGGSTFRCVFPVERTTTTPASTLATATAD